jgi:arsenite-transporting ATPase
VRIILFTGKGGVGKTTAAAGTATLAASRGLRTLVMSTDSAHSLGDAFDRKVGAEPTPVTATLSVQQVDAQRRFQESWTVIQQYLLSVLDAAGVDPITAEELTVLPGAEEVLALLELRRHVVSGEWDVIVVDCAPTAETLRLLALPEALGWYMDRIFPMERRIVKALKPVLAKAAGVPMPHDSVFDAVERLHRDLEEVQGILTGKETSVRLVLTPENVVVAEARRSLTTLSLFGYQVDGVVANRVFPDEGADDWRSGWVEAQREVLRTVEESFVGLPVWRSAYHPHEPVGVAALETFATAAYGDADPLAVPDGEGPVTVRRTGRGATLRMALPFIERADVDLAGGDRGVLPPGARPAHRPAPARGGRSPGRGRRAPGQVRAGRGGRGVTDDQVGSVGEEAAKLLGALQDWARQAGDEGRSGGAAGGAADGLGDYLRTANEHLATGGAECRYCPLCQLIAFVRHTSPEVRAHLGTAAGSLLQAGAAFLAAQSGSAGQRQPGVQKIDLDDDDAADDLAWDEADWDAD